MEEVNWLFSGKRIREGRVEWAAVMENNYNTVSPVK